MKHNYLLFNIFVCFFASTVSRESIIGGQIAKKDQFPYQVSIVVYGHGHNCGGGIIGERHVLTAAHCVLLEDGKFDSTFMRILAGTNDLRRVDLGISVEVEKLYVPIEYKPSDIFTTGDIAVLRLRQPFELYKNTNLKALKLPRDRRQLHAGQRMIVAGFGYDWMRINRDKSLIIDGGTNDTLLRYTETLVVRPHDKSYPIGNYCDKKHLCARSDQIPDPRAVCFGDSGSPLVLNGKVLIGVLSITPWGCLENEESAVYTRVVSYLDFIDYAVRDKRHKAIRTHYLPVESKNLYNIYSSGHN